MIKKLRCKFVLTIMSIVAVFLLTILVSMFFSTKSDWENRSWSTLFFVLDTKIPSKEEQPDLRTPVVVAVVDADGTIRIQENHIPNYTEEEAEAATLSVLESEEDRGVLEEDELRFLRQSRADGEIAVAFGDISMELNSLRAQAIHSLLIGLGALAGFFLISLFLSRSMIRPVEQAWAERKQFIADASHEFKTPLTVVLSNIEMLTAHNIQADEKSRRWMDNIQAESFRMKHLLEAMLTLVRYDQIAEQKTHNQVNFSFVIKRSLMTFEPAIYESGLRLAEHIADLVFVNGDPEKLRQLTDILLDNAQKYSNRGGLITVSLVAAEKRAHLTVSNEGESIPANELPRIFRRFYRLDKSRKEHGGYGLGLAIAQDIVRAHDGKVWAESKDGVNTFFVDLPLS